MIQYALMFGMLSSTSRDTRCHLQVVGARRELESAALEDGVLRMERERDEREEPAGRILLLAQSQHVVDALFVGLDVTVEQRAMRRDPHLVRGVVNVEPVLGRLLAGRDQLAHARREDLGAAARERTEARVLQDVQHLFVRAALELRHVMDLGGRIELQVHVGKRGLQLAQYIRVELEVDVRVLAVDAMDLGEARELVLRECVLDKVVSADRVRILLLLRLREGAELAFHAADVRLVQVEVLDEVDLVATAAHAARQIGELAECEQVIRFHEGESVLEVEAFARFDLLANGCERVDGVEDRHLPPYLSLLTTACVSDSSSSRCSSPLRHARALLA